MSQESVEIVRRFLIVDDVDEALKCADPGIVWNPIEELPTKGHDAVRESLARWKAEWHDYNVVPEEFLDMGERVVVTVRLRGRGRGSVVEVAARFYEVYTLRDGKIVRIGPVHGAHPGPRGCGAGVVRRRLTSAVATAAGPSARGRPSAPPGSNTSRSP